MKRVDMLGKTFGRLTVISDAGKDKHGRYKYNCLCSCGNSKVVCGSKMRKGNTLSCGCLRLETKTSHGLHDHPLYRIHHNIKNRCYNKKQKGYHNYGGRGITVCGRWLESFENFFDDVIRGYEKGLELDRIDNDGNYEPSNVRWVTKQQNAMNRGNTGGNSKYKGVLFNKRNSKWFSRIKVNGVSIYLGEYTNEIDAAKAYNKAAERYFGEYAYLNPLESERP